MARLTLDERLREMAAGRTAEMLARWQVEQFEDAIDHLGPDAAAIFLALRAELPPAQLDQVWRLCVHVSDHSGDRMRACCDAERG